MNRPEIPGHLLPTLTQKTQSKSADGERQAIRSADQPHQTTAPLRRSPGRVAPNYALAIFAVILALLLTLQIKLLAARTPFALFFATVVIITWYCGRNPGMLAVILSALASAYFLIPPYSLIPDFEGAAQLGVFVSLALAISWLTDARKDSEKSLRRSEERYRLLFENSPLPMWVYDTETLRFLEINDAALRQYGYTRGEFLSMTIGDIRPAEELPKLMDVVSQLEYPFGEMRVWKHKKKNGTVIDAEITAHSLDFNGQPARLVLANDVTERRTLEDQLRQSQKMEAIGILAGGIAHDFNNLLTAIAGYSELTLRRLPAGDPLRPNIEEIFRAGERASNLIGQLLAFSRKQVLQPKVFDLNSVVSNLEKMLRRLIGEDIQLRTAQSSTPGNVKADPGQIEQIIMNLVVNARDAMPNGGKLTIETAMVTLDEDYARTHIDVIPGHFMMLAVSDTGIGMDEATQKRIFEPFFSTKDPGRGTGLGLSTTYGIVKQSGGNIWVYSEPGKGTTFKIYLPLVEETAEAAGRDVKTVDSLLGTETILLAEDEEIVRNLAREVLKTYGYKVLEAANGPEALSICESYKEKIHLLITDVIMPEMSGRELSAGMAKLYPEIKVLFMSGYTDSAIIHQGVLEEDANFIQKPFPTDELARKVREVLNPPSIS